MAKWVINKGSGYFELKLRGTQSKHSPSFLFNQNPSMHIERHGYILKIIFQPRKYIYQIFFDKRKFFKKLFWK